MILKVLWVIFLLHVQDTSSTRSPGRNYPRKFRERDLSKKLIEAGNPFSYGPKDKSRIDRLPTMDEPKNETFTEDPRRVINEERKSQEIIPSSSDQPSDKNEIANDQYLLDRLAPMLDTTTLSEEAIEQRHLKLFIKPIDDSNYEIVGMDMTVFFGSMGVVKRIYLPAQEKRHIIVPIDPMGVLICTGPRICYQNQDSLLLQIQGLFRNNPSGASYFLSKGCYYLSRTFNKPVPMRPRASQDRQTIRSTFTSQ